MTIYRWLIIFLSLGLLILGATIYYLSDFVSWHMRYVSLLDQQARHRYYAQLAEYLNKRYRSNSVVVLQDSNAEELSCGPESVIAADEVSKPRRAQVKSLNSLRKSYTYSLTKLGTSKVSKYGFYWPLERTSFWLSSKFGPRKIGKTSRWGYHYGIDLAACKGTPVMAAADGVITEAAFSTRGYGKTVVIRHHHGRYETRYAHLDEIFVRVGQRIRAGMRIGAVGDTGYVRGENGGKNAHHLHFEVKKAGRFIDPLCVLA